MSGIVLIAELLNTAIEVLVDLVSPDIHPKAKIIKDVAAAAVLVSALTAVVVGLVIFIPKIFNYAT
ncbi:Undecaprenol kinase [compost metagenome]